MKEIDLEEKNRKARSNLDLSSQCDTDEALSFSVPRTDEDDDEDKMFTSESLNFSTEDEDLLSLDWSVYSVAMIVSPSILV